MNAPERSDTARSVASATLLRLSQVCRHYGSGEAQVKALDGVDLEIGAGEFVAIVGQSGSGKSTLMNLLGCLDRPTAGRYEVLGRDVATLSPDELAALARDAFGFVFQRYNLLADATDFGFVDGAGTRMDAGFLKHVVLFKADLSY